MATAVAPKSSARSASTEPTFQIGIARAALLEALTRAVMAAPKRTTLPVLNCALIRAEKGRLGLMCTDLDHTVETSVEAVVSGHGTAALPAKRLLEIVSALPSSATLEITVKDTRARVVTGRSKFEIIGMPVEEFPAAIQKPQGDAEAEFDADFVRAITRVAPHASNAMSRPALNCALLEIDELGASVVATDSTRIARVGIQVRQSSKPLQGNFSIPRNAFVAISKLFGDDKTVTIGGTRQQLRIAGETSTLSLRMVEEPFPLYKQVLAVPPTARVILDRTAFADAIRRVGAIADRERVELTFTERDVTLATVTQDAGDAEDVIDCAFSPSVEMPAPLSVALNPQHLIYALDAMQGEQARIDFTDTKNPVYIRNAAEPDSPTVAVMLPLRAPGEGGTK